MVRVLVLWKKRSPSAAASPVHMVGSPKNDRILKGKWAFKKAGGNCFFSESLGPGNLVLCKPSKGYSGVAASSHINEITVQSTIHPMIQVPHSKFNLIVFQLSN